MAGEKPQDLSVIGAKIDIALIKLSVLDSDHEKLYGKVIDLDKTQKRTQANFVDAMTAHDQKTEQIIAVLQKVSNEVLVVRRAVEPGRLTRLGIMFAGSVVGGALVSIIMKAIGLDLTAKLFAMLQ